MSVGQTIVFCGLPSIHHLSSRRATGQTTENDGLPHGTTARPGRLTPGPWLLTPSPAARERGPKYQNP